MTGATKDTSLNKPGEILQQYDYGCSQTDASSNLRYNEEQQSISSDWSYIGTNKQWTKRFSYDSVNRLNQESGTAATQNLAYGNPNTIMTLPFNINRSQ